MERLKNNPALNVTQMLAILAREGQVTCNSSKNRYKLYQVLKKKGLVFKSEIIGYTESRKNAMDVHDGPLYDNISLIAKWVYKKRFNLEDLLEQRNTSITRWKSIWPQYELDIISEEDLRAMFEEGMTKKGIRKILERWEGYLDTKYHIFDWCPFRKAVKRIRLVTLEMEKGQDVRFDFK